MSERDRLAELLERVTRERQAAAGDGARPGDQPAEGVTGGEWLPPEPVSDEGSPDERGFSAPRHRASRGSPGFLTWPDALRSVRLVVRPSAVAGILVVVLVAGAIFGLRWWRAEEASQPVPVASSEPARLASEDQDSQAATGSGPSSPTATSQPGGTAPPGGSATPEGAAPPGDAAPQQVLVHVAGQVRSPGVVTLGVGARVLDAVEAAGGLTAEADTDRVNLARPVTDGERIWVPRPGEEVPEMIEDPAPAADPGAGPSGGGGEEVRVDLNTADQAALEELPGVGPVTAAAIIQWRTDHGQFSSTDELLEVSGIGEATLEKLLPHVTL